MHAMFNSASFHDLENYDLHCFLYELSNYFKLLNSFEQKRCVNSNASNSLVLFKF